MNQIDATRRKEEIKSNETSLRADKNLVENAIFNDLAVGDYPLETGRFQRLFKEKEKVGAGGYGEVYKAVHNLDKGIYAIKKVAIRESSFANLNITIERMLREVSAMVKLNHQSIVRYISCWMEKHNDEEEPSEYSPDHSSIKEHIEINDYNFKLWKAPHQEQSEQESSENNYDSESCSAFGFDRDEEESSKQKPSEQKIVNKDKPERLKNVETKDLKNEDFQVCLYIQLEYCAGENLKHYLHRPKSQRPVIKMLEMFHRILDGVNTFHKAGILHRDLKPANIFLDGNENIKIGDFGLALSHSDRRKETHEIKEVNKGVELSLTQKVGTSQYMSPEMKSNSKKYNHKTDIYSLGIIFYEMLSEFKSEHERSELLSCLCERKEIEENFKREFPEESEIILKMTNMNPKARPNANDLIHVFSKLKNHYYNQKFKEGQAKVIGYNKQKIEPPPIVNSLMVENEKGVFHIVQGLKGVVTTNPPNLGKIITYKYTTVDAEGSPLNPIFKG